MFNWPSVRRIDAYLAFAAERPELFSNAPGGVRILLDRDQIAEVENRAARSIRKQGLDPSGAQVGIVLRDPWFFVLRDAVEFPTGARRLHARCVNRVGNGVAALPVMDGRILLLRHYRHAARRWMREIPRGAIEPGQSQEDAVRQELLEEMGASAKHLERTGFAHGLSNLSYNGAHLHFAELSSIGEPQLDEGIVAIDQVTVPEFEDLVTSGEITDSFTIAAFLHARLRGLV